MSNSSTNKGDIFESRVYSIISDLVYNDEFYVSGKRSRVFSKKGYYSENRKNEIIVDISIESYLENSNQYSILTILECKNYGKRGVPVDAIEEFSSKLNQIGAHCTKGIMVTNSHFQKGTIVFAKSEKIGLLRINETNELDWVNRRKDSNSDYVYDRLITELRSIEPISSFVSLYNNKRINCLSDLLIEIGIIDIYYNKPKYINIPYRTEHEIGEYIELENLYDYYNDDQLNTKELCNYLEKEYRVSFKFDEDLGYDGSSKILGELSFSPLTISISKELKVDTHRWRFTLAHEIGHLMLHFKVLINYLDKYYDNDSTIQIESDNLFSYYNKRLEIQANLFASRLLIPQKRLIMHVQDFFIKERIFEGYLYLDKQRCNINTANKLLFELQSLFNVSKEAAKIRLISQNLLIDKTNLSLQKKYRR